MKITHITLGWSGETYEMIYYDYINWVSYLNSLPWDQKTIIGYIGMMCYHLFTADMVLLLNGAFFILFISLCLHQEAFYEIFHRKLQHIEKNQKLIFEVINFDNSVKKLVLFWLDLIIKNRICGFCQQICPWQKPHTHEKSFQGKNWLKFLFLVSFWIQFKFTAISL